MELETVRRVRRVLSAVVAASAIMLVMARMRSPPGGAGDSTGTLASIVFLISLITFIVVWRKEHAAVEGGFAEREQKQLAALRLQVELAQLAAKKKGGGADMANDAIGSPTGEPIEDLEQR